jgi:hypothetical protein
MLRRKDASIAVVLSALFILAMGSPASATAAHTGYVGLYFPAGMPGTDTTCPYTWVEPAFCVTDLGKNGIPAVHFVGQGVGPYVGQHMSGDVGRVPDPYNLDGRIVEVGRPS